MPRPLDSVPCASELPSRADVVIIGGGIIGASTALVLAERGISVALCEKGVIGGEQSSRNFGLCRQTRRDPAEMELMIRGIEIWKGLKARVGGETGFVQKGLMFTCDTEAEIAKYDSALKTAREFGLDTKVLSSAEVMARLPGITRKLAGAIFTASDGSAEPQHATSSVAKGAIAKGAKMIANCAVRGFETSAGRISAVVTERGSIQCGTAILAAGLWSRRFLANLGLDLPMLNIHTWVQATEPLDGPPDEVVFGSDFLFRRRLDGGWNIGRLDLTAPLVPDSFLLGPRYRHVLKNYLGAVRPTLGKPFFDALVARKRWSNVDMTPFERDRVMELPINAKVLATCRAENDAVVPYFRNARIAHQWTGVFEVLPDELPVMSTVESRPGLVLATGFSGHGFGIGPAAGQVVADIVTGAPPLTNIAPFSFERFRKRAQRVTTH